MSSPLFSLPEYHTAFTKFFGAAVRELMKSKDAVLGKIQTEEREHIPTTQISMPSGNTVELEKIQAEMKFTIHADDIIKGNLERLVVNIDEASDQGLESLMPQFFKYLNQVCEASGNVVDAKGEPFSYDLLLKVLDKIEIPFDENGNPELPTMVVHQDMLEKLRKLPPPTEEQLQKHKEIIDRKRKEHNDRRRNRKLS